MNQIKDTIKRFNKVSLADLNQVSLMNRTDRKYCLHIAHLPSVLEAIQDYYFMLTIEGETIFNYDNTYFGTSDDQILLNHQNGKLNRTKVRIREYVQTDENFLEVKLKNNKGRTVKRRIERPDLESNFSHTDLNFLEDSTSHSGLLLEPKIRSYYNRFTLVDKEFSERVTVDLSPGFEPKDNAIVIAKLVIIEIKQSRATKPALIAKALKRNKIREQGFSKYCIGRALLEEKIKKNNFKPLLIKIRKEFSN